MSKAKLSTAEWELVRNAPYWVNRALAEADGRQSLLARRRENKAFEKAIEEYKSSNALIRDIVADDGDAAKEVGRGSQADAEAALSRIAGIVHDKLGEDDLKELQAFLKQVGHAVASATKEGGLGKSGVVSEKESAALARIESAMKVSSAYTTAHSTAQPQAKPAATTKPAPAAKPSASAKPAPATRDDDKKQEQEKKLAEARERQEKARAEADAKRKQEEAKERLEKARKETEERQAAAAAEREAAEREREAAAEREAQAQAEAEAVGASPYREFIAEHTVQPGDNLSFISQRYYGTQANFRIIYEANRDVIGDNMNLIKPGQKLRIPKL